MNRSEKQTCLNLLKPGGKNRITINTIKSIKTIQTQLRCGFQGISFWKSFILVVPVFQFFEIYTP